MMDICSYVSAHRDLLDMAIRRAQEQTLCRLSGQVDADKRRWLNGLF